MLSLAAGCLWLVMLCLVAGGLVVGVALGYAISSERAWRAEWRAEHHGRHRADADSLSWSTRPRAYPPWLYPEPHRTETTSWAA